MIETDEETWLLDDPYNWKEKTHVYHKVAKKIWFGNIIIIKIYLTNFDIFRIKIYYYFLLQKTHLSCGLRESWNSSQLLSRCSFT